MSDFPRQPDFPLLPPPREDRAGTAREEDTPESQLTRGLETQLERFLDIFCFVQQFSCEPVTHEALPEKIALAEDSFFGISLPCCANYAILIVANENSVLPEWYENPGVAGKSRLTFLAGNLSDLLVRYSEIIENQSVCPQENWTDFQAFLNSEKYSAGKMRAEPGFFARLELTQNARLLAFSMMRFDGKPGRGWLLTGVKNPEILRFFQEKHPFRPAEKTYVLQRVRNLEKLSVEEMPEIEEDFAAKNDLPVEKSAPATAPEPEIAQNTANIPNFQPLELYVRLSDGDSPGAKMDETLILGEKPECSSVNTDEIQYVREEHLIPFNPEKFAREFHTFLASRHEKRLQNRLACCPKMHFETHIKTCNYRYTARDEAIRLFFAHAHPQLTQRWRNVTGDFSDLREHESKKSDCPPENTPLRAEDLWETAETAETPRHKQPVLPPETVLQQIPVTLRAVLGRKKLPVEAILALKPGVILDFGPANTQNMEIFVSDKDVARGEMLAVGTSVAVEILKNLE